MSEKRFVPNNYKTSFSNSIAITDTALTGNKEIIILDLSDGTSINGPVVANSYVYDREINFGKANYISKIVTSNRTLSVTLTIKINKVESWDSCKLRFIKLKFTNGFGVKQNTTGISVGFRLYIKMVDLNNEIIAFSNGGTSGTYTLLSRNVTSSSPINVGSWDGTYLIDLADKTLKSYTNDLLLKAFCVKDIINPIGDSLTQTINPEQSTLSDIVARSFLNNTYSYDVVHNIYYPEYLGIHNTCTFNIYDKNYELEDELLGNVKILKPTDVIPVAGTDRLKYTTYNLYIKQLQPISDLYYFRFILTTINGVPNFKNTGRYKCIININFQFGDANDVRTFTFRATIDPNAIFTMPTQFLVDIQEEQYLPFKETTISSSVKTEYEDLLNYAIAEPFIDKPAADYIVEPIGDWDNEDESNTEGDV